jgi:hypothetical protein
LWLWGLHGAVSYSAHAPFFVVTAGLWPYYDLLDEEKIQKLTLTGARPYLHPAYRKRSLIERRMTEIMDRCHVLEPAGRPDIFTVLRHLQETKQLHEQRSTANA